MKKTTFLLWGMLLCGISSYSQTQFWSDTFEDSGTPSSGIRNAPTAFFNSVNQFFNRLDNTAISCTSGAYTNVEGSKFWAGEDTDGGQTITVANVLKTVTWTGISISGKTNISLKGLFAVGNNNTNVFDNGSASSTGVYDYMSIQYAIDGGPIQNLLNFYPLANSNSSLYIDANFDGIGDANTTPLSNTFTEYTGQINGTGNTLTLYLNMSLTGFSEEVAVDNLRLLTNRENSSREVVGKSGLPCGVRRAGAKYTAYIRIGNTRPRLGLFNTIEEASQAYQNKLKTLS
jgi:hypothetical protein